MFTPISSVIKIVISVIIIISVFLLGYFTGQYNNSSANTKQFPAPQIDAKQIINKSFDFPVNDANGNEITHFTYTITEADLQNQIILKGQPATAIKGHIFLVLNIKIGNASTQSLSINTRDYVRLSVDNSHDTLAPDIHNDPVQVQPISTTPTRIGFTINNSDKNLVLKVGELKGNKISIPLNLKN